MSHVHQVAEVQSEEEVEYFLGDASNCVFDVNISGAHDLENRPTSIFLGFKLILESYILE